MNAVESAPSAKRSRNRFGNRNAIKNASRFRPAPNSPANTISRTSPRMRLDRMAMPTTPVARVLIRRSSAAAIGEQRTASADLRKEKTYDHESRECGTNEHKCSLWRALSPAQSTQNLHACEEAARIFPLAR